MDLITKFNENQDNVSVFLLSTRSGGMGINLTAANHIIIHDIDINPYNDKQAEDRVHRIGQTRFCFFYISKFFREVYVTRLITKNSIEEVILEMAHKKLALEKDVTSSNGSDEQLNSRLIEEMLSRALVKHENSPSKQKVR